ncbi:cadmium, zinc and cobalt-transporting ATPase [Lachnoanaerobaculum sp. ICM7]|jgi:ATPase, P-type (transporting), HAD superfamily, subfamily IC/heavy metal translocating P-type ATPase|uniref:heavy metal translocating P-type ATPase n=1 Tax=Lachnoanaerobaculum sp. ICM7 TaxID=936594 RepID=UPI00027A3A72|nr:heavy metal translocating P-type ATPase [Lachnoanaerobaculum sp. ICM7]EJP18378.1 cadmium, zinc and cobalt-transporting ATPase [Lachnoanaerobaculum sp. ICM7]
MNDKQKKMLRKIIIGASLYIIAVIVSKINFSMSNIISFGLFIAAYIIVGKEVLLKAFSNIKRGKVFDENFLMTIATVGAVIIGEYPEAVGVMLFYMVGEFLQSLAVNKSRKSISDMMNIRPDYANLVKEDGSVETVDPYDVEVGSYIQIKAGEIIPLDGIVVSGKAMLDTSALTGESVPRSANAGDQVYSGSINKDGLLKLEVTKEFSESTASKILDLVENAAAKKSKTENFISKFAGIYTPIVVFAAIALAVIPPFIFPGTGFATWIYRALTFLVVSCPCAFVIAIPLSFFSGIGASSKIGVLIKGSNYLELLAGVRTFVFDKTGTLTKGVFEVVSLHPNNVSEEELLSKAAMAEEYSSHPIAISIKKAYEELKTESEENTNISDRLSDLKEIAGHGISIKVDGKEVLVGNDKLMSSNSIDFEKSEEFGSVVYVAEEGKFLGSIVINDRIKEDAGESLIALKSVGVEKSVMLTGDIKEVADVVANELGIDYAYSELLPQDKVEKVEEELDDNKILAFVGDGLNDAPVLARADIGIAMGGIGSDAAIEAADVVIMDDKLYNIVRGIKLAKRTMSIAKQNIIFALGVKLIFLLLAAIGFGTMWEAVFADVGVTVLCVINAMRNLQTKNI